MRPRKLTLEQREEIARRYEAGEGGPTLAKEFNITVPVIYDVLRSQGITVRTQPAYKTGEKVKSTKFYDRKEKRRETTKSLLVLFQKNQDGELLETRAEKAEPWKLFVKGVVDYFRFGWEPVAIKHRGRVIVEGETIKQAAADFRSWIDDLYGDEATKRWGQWVEYAKRLMPPFVE